MKNYRHFIITRFNIAVAYKCTSKNNYIKLFETNLNNEYLAERFRLFEKYTIPSINSQTNKNFKWLVLFHEDTDKCFKDKIRQYQDEMEEFEPIFVPGDKDANNFLHEYFEKNNNKQWIVTTRMDNDDAIHKNYVQMIQKQLKDINEKTIISYSTGLKYDLRDGLFSKQIYESNHFLTLVAKNSEIYNHIYFQDHGEILSSGVNVLTQKTNNPMWVEIIHETNYINSPVYKIGGMLILYKDIKDYKFLSKGIIDYCFKEICFLKKSALVKLNVIKSKLKKLNK